MLLFFFQEEDGIRYYKVTGVQTCALPICHTDQERLRRVGSSSSCARARSRKLRGARAGGSSSCFSSELRSEERRVGIECRTFCTLYTRKKRYQTSKHYITIL